MCFDIDLFAIDHSKVASYKNRSSGGLHALCAKALAKAYENLDYVILHRIRNLMYLQAGSGFQEYVIRIVFLINRAFAFLQRMLYKNQPWRVPLKF